MNATVAQFRSLLHRYPLFSVIVLGTAVGLILEVYSHRFYHDARRSFDSARSDWTWVVDNRPELARLGRNAPAGQHKSATALTGFINTTLQKYSLQAARLVPRKNGDIGLWFDSVDADALIRWLFDSEQTHTVRVDEVSITRLGKPGLVSARLTVGYR